MTERVLRCPWAFSITGQASNSCLAFTSFFVSLIPEEKALVYQSNSDFPVRETPTKASVFILQYGK
jgi:hypothetical protein